MALKKKHDETEHKKAHPAPSSSALLKDFKFDPLMEPKATRHGDLKGDKGLLYFLNPREGSYTHYAGNHTGKQVGDNVKAEILDTFTVSAMQLPSPDPVVQKTGVHRADRFETETKQIHNRMPLTGNVTLSPVQQAGHMASTRKTRFFDSNAFNSTY